MYAYTPVSPPHSCIHTPVSPPHSYIPHTCIHTPVSPPHSYLHTPQLAAPFALLGGLHFAAITDLAWSTDGQFLVASSRDGYCRCVCLSVCVRLSLSLCVCVCVCCISMLITWVDIKYEQVCMQVLVNTAPCHTPHPLVTTPYTPPCNTVWLPLKMVSWVR